MERKAIKKSVRFEVFKRDSFTCQYCGSKAPDVVLEIEHITPVAAGGGNDILNLVTACRGCNAGKSARPLSANAAMDKRRRQLEDLEERRRQLQMLHEWHLSLIDLDGQAVDMAERLWGDLLSEPGYRWTQAGRDEMRKIIKKHGFDRACEAIHEAAGAALRSTDLALHRDEVTNDWFWKIGAVASVLQMDRERPGVRRLMYIRGICRRRFRRLHESDCLDTLQRAYDAGVGVEWMESTAKRCGGWSEWKQLMEDAIDYQNRGA
jgi:HNH endonuclease